MQLDEPSAADIRAELAHLLASAGFARNARMSRFLTFLVDRHLEGRDGELKESLIAHEVFGRRPDYDPKQDSIVRTEAARLRARLAEHYAGAGRHASVIVDIPKGGYIPAFRYREVPIDDAARPAAAGRARSHRLLVAGLCAAIVLGGAAWWSPHGQHTPVPIAVLPLTNLGHDPSGDPFADGLTGELVRNLSVIDGLAVRSRSSALLFTDRARDARDIGPRLGVDYLIDGSVLRAGDALRIDVQLVRTRDGVAVWSGYFDRPIGDIFEVEDEIALAIVNKLRLHLGRGRRRYETSVAAYDDYLGARAIRFGADPWGYAERISGFERALGRDPTFAPAYAGLASTYAIRSVQFPLDHPPDELTKLRAAADKAIEIDSAPDRGLRSAGDGGRARRALARRGTGVPARDRDGSGRLAHACRVRDVVPRGAWPQRRGDRAGAPRRDRRSARVRRPDRIRLVPDGSGQIRGGRVALREAAVRRQLASAVSRPGAARAGAHRGRDCDAARRRRGAFQPADPRLSRVRARARRTARGGAADVADPKGPNEEALIYAGLGDKDRTIDALERMAARGAQRAGQYLYSPELSSLLAGDPRLPALRKKIGLPE
ncbi:MAG TPA: hypothetical protein VHI99_20980 [Vicinamibacterales bacterium]|nr:hypothetical protein [Vicinamibacterales bacterium]